MGMVMAMDMAMDMDTDMDMVSTNVRLSHHMVITAMDTQAMVILIMDMVIMVTMDIMDITDIMDIMVTAMDTMVKHLQINTSQSFVCLVFLHPILHTTHEMLQYINDCVCTYTVLADPTAVRYNI